MKKKLDHNYDIFAQLKINPNIAEVFNSKFVDISHEDFFQRIRLKKAIWKELILNTTFKKSYILPNILLIYTEMYKQGIDENNYQQIEELHSREFAELILEIMQACGRRTEANLLSFYQMKKLIEEHPKLILTDVNKCHKIDLFRISGTMGDYFLLKDIKSILSQSKTSLAREFLKTIADFKIQLSNAISLIDMAEIDLNDKLFYSNDNPLKGKALKLTSSMQDEIMQAINFIKELNSTIFLNTINKQFLQDLENSLKEIENSTDFDFMFLDLHYAMERESRLSLRAKKLLMHDIFRAYNHPRAITEQEEDMYLEKEESTIDKLEMRKIRVIEALIPQMK